MYLWAGPGCYPLPANQALSGGSGGFPPGSRRRTQGAFLPLLERRALLAREADPSYSRGGPSLPEGRTLLTREADLLTREAGAPYSKELSNIEPLTRIYILEETRWL